MARQKFSAVPTQADQGATISIMLNGMVIAATPGNTEVDRYMADWIVSCLDQVDAMGLGPFPEEIADG